MNAGRLYWKTWQDQDARRERSPDYPVDGHALKFLVQALSQWTHLDLDDKSDFEANEYACRPSAAAKHSDAHGNLVVQSLARQ